MKAIVCREYGPLDLLRVEDLPEPTPGPGQVLMRVHAAGVNYPDALLVQGKHQYKPALPLVPGSEFSGVIEALGPGVTGFSVGQAVYASRQKGGFAERCVADVDKLLPKPPQLSFEQTAALSVTYNTSYYALVMEGRIQPGETLLVLGAAGGTGLSAIEIAKALGCRVIAAASSDDKLALCREHGADALINYARDDLRARLKEVCPQGVDVVYDPVGGAYAEPALRALAWRGRYLVVGFASNEIPKIPLNLVLLKNAYIIGIFLGETWTREAHLAQQIDRGMGELIAAGKIQPSVSATYPLSGTRDALQALLDRQAMGKLVIVPNQD